MHIKMERKKKRNKEQRRGRSGNRGKEKQGKMYDYESESYIITRRRG